MSSNKKYVGSARAEKEPLRWVIFGSSLVTLAFWTNLHDPFNAPKSWILSISGMWLLGWVIFQLKRRWKVKSSKMSIIIPSLYLLSLVTSFLATDNKFIGFFGEYQRRTGLLAYVSLMAFFFAASLLIDQKSVTTLDRAAIIIGFFLGTYGLLQHFKHDFVNWSNPYNPIISTLGNPDFSAAAMAIFAVLNFGILIQNKFFIWTRILAGLNVIVLLFTIYLSQVRQGLLCSIFGITIIVIIWIYQRNRTAAHLVASLTTLIGLVGLLGMLNQGPLSKYFYKISVTYRGDYWRAGWRMIIHNPLFGVGLDRYGANFRKYRDATQVARRGPDLVSNAAHNVPIQLASTGGLVVLLTFILLIAFIFLRGIQALRKSSGTEQITIGVLFAAWLSYEAQSFISIDNLGIAIWGYVLGGAIVGISYNHENNLKRTSLSIIQRLISWSLAIAALAISAVFLQSEISMKTLSMYRVPQTQTSLEAYETLARKPVSLIFKEPTFEVLVAADLAQANDPTLAISNLKNVIASDPRFFDAKELLARIYEFQKDWQHAAQVRSQMVNLDPFKSALKLRLRKDLNNSQRPTPSR